MTINQEQQTATDYFRQHGSPFFSVCYAAVRIFILYLDAVRQVGRQLLTVVCTVLLIGQISLSAHAGQVTVSNYPLSLLSQAVTKGTAPAKVLLKAGDVGHHGSLSPGDMKTIQDSQFVVWFGSPLEQNLADSLRHAPNSIALLDFDAFTRYPLRRIDTSPIEGSLDPHIWLDPDNAKAIVRALAVIHSHADPKHKQQYQANAQDFAKRMDAVVSQQRQQHPESRPYWAHHDAYQYIESALNLKLAGTLTPDHHLPPKASQFVWLNANRPNAHMCLLTQGNISRGISNKLAPVSTSSQQEDMSQGDEFVAVWQQMAEDINDCIAGR